MQLSKPSKCSGRRTLLVVFGAVSLVLAPLLVLGGMAELDRIREAAERMH